MELSVSSASGSATDSVSKGDGEENFFEMSVLCDSIDITSCCLGTGFTVCLVSLFIKAADVYA